ncbi:MAG: hypothetical protein U9N08_03560 [Candidatus Caldatribacteriota bacterium]|nr:hypothetical protein [Candidatus Caldatribacteriota bacterium]
MKKISFKNIFKKSETGKKFGSGKTIFLLIIILLIAVGAYFGYPLLFPEKTVAPTVVEKTISGTAPIKTVSETKVEPVEKEKTQFDIEVEQREKGYENKIFTYEPYEAPSNRNPFQKVSNFYSSELVESKEEETEGGAIRFPKPELPPGTMLTGIINSPDKKIAIIEMNEETYIAKLYDILSDRYIVKEIKKDEVLIDISGYIFSLKIGGEDLADEL